jgi:hypothetical protein
MIADIWQHYESIFASDYYWFNFQISGRRSYGCTRCTNRKEAEKIEAQERAKAEAPIKASSQVAGSLQIDHVAARDWQQIGQHHAGADTTSRDLARLADHFGKDKLNY